MRGPAPSGSARCGWCCPARRRCRPRLIEEFVDRDRRSPSTRATASPRRRRSSPARCAAQRRTRPARSAPPCPASRSGWSTTTGDAPEGDDPGEIQIRGANLFTGYWPDGDDGPDADGWWATGDVGFLDRDGDLFLVDRLKELVIVSGFNVYPSRSRTSSPRSRGRRGRRDRGRRRARPARPSWRTSWRPAATRTGVADGGAPRTARTRLARFKRPSRDRGRRRAAAAPSPARSRRAGCAAAERRRALGLLE